MCNKKPVIKFHDFILVYLQCALLPFSNQKITPLNALFSNLAPCPFSGLE